MNEIELLLNSKCNENQTYLDFIKESEKVFEVGYCGLELKDMTKEQILCYIEYFDYLWEK